MKHTETRQPARKARLASLTHPAVLLALFSLPAATIAAQPGDLDTSFDGDGRVITDFGGDDYAYAVARQQDGRIVAAGQFSPSGATNFAVARYRRHGQLDPTFGGDGRVVVELPGDPQRLGLASAVLVQPDGRIIAGGYFAELIPDGAGRSGFALVRLRRNGTLDRSFGGDGIVTTSRRNVSPLWALALQQDGKIVAVGQAGDPATGHSDVALARYLPNGRLDPSFGDRGVVVTPSNGLNDAARAVAIQPDGKIVVAGRADPVPGQLEFMVARYLSNGAPDPTFGTNGSVSTFVAEGFAATGMALQPDGRIVTVGQGPGISSHFAFVRYLADGSLDPTFDADGQLIVEISGGAGFGNGVTLQSDGKIVGIGAFSEFSTGRRSFTVIRLLQNGALDVGFGGVGYVITDIGEGNDAIANAVVLQPNGKIVAAGLARNAQGESDFALARYHGRTTPDTTSDVDD